jgi:hypothetical protein
MIGITRTAPLLTAMAVCAALGPALLFGQRKASRSLLETLGRVNRRHPAT